MRYHPQNYGTVLPHNASSTHTMTHLFSSTVYKPTAATPLGLHLWQAPHGGGVIVVHLDDHGLFSHKLKTGLQIVKINNVECQGRTMQEIRHYLDQHTGPLTVLAKAPAPLLPPHHNQQSCSRIEPLLATGKESTSKMADQEDDDTCSTVSESDEDASSGEFVNHPLAENSSPHSVVDDCLPICALWLAFAY